MIRLALSFSLALSLTACAEDDALVDGEELATEASLLSGDDIGVIPESGANCPGASVAMRLDNEDDDNNNQRSGWFGQWKSGKNTDIRFCKVSSSAFKQPKGLTSAANYAVLQLGASCPEGSVAVTRYFDNEDNACGVMFPNVQACGSAGSYETGTIAPSKFGGNGGDNLWLRLCVFKAKSTGSSSPFPALGFSYGVMGGGGVPNAMGTGWVRTDDEDDNNNNSWDNPTDVNLDSVITGSDNTKIFTVRVR